jgi:hypothetical protein
VLLDTLSATDPAAAWRHIQSMDKAVQDRLLQQPWTSAAAWHRATARERYEKGWPCLADAALLLSRWMQQDPAAALATTINTSTSQTLHAAAIETALSPHGGAFDRDTLLKWIATLPTATQVNLEPVITKLTGMTREAPPATK